MSTVEFTKDLSGLSKVLRTFAYSLTKDTEDANDLYQETALRALSNRNKFRPGTNFKAWLFTIMKNIFINNYRRKSKANTVFDSTDNLYYLNSGSVVIDNGAETKMMMDDLNSMIDDLEDNLRIPFLMHFDGYKYQEIADDLELPLGTVKSRIFFARKALKSKILLRYNYLENRLEKKLA